ncbi:hypothetical protein K438DRAFT_2111335 [Mycena galopus ATCC 62051]|nr:hypothetical protein K438DRAFT_2111335 [Mycena galopus ATCC 62051]
MSTKPSGASLTDASENWCDAPPHLPSDISAATQFASARTHLGDARLSASGARSVSPTTGQSGQGEPASPGRNTSPIPSGSPTPGTASPFASTGLSAKMMTDGHGNSFLIEQATGMRIDISQVSGPTLSDKSDIPDTNTSTTNAKMTSIMENLEHVPLPPDQEEALNQLRGAILIGRERLFATTSLAVGTQDEIHDHHEELEDFKVEVARQFDEMHDKIQSHHTQLDSCISKNVKALRDLGTSENLLGKLVTAATEVRARQIAPSTLMYRNLQGGVHIPPDISAGAFHALPPRRDEESLEEFRRRVEALLARKEKAAAAFVSTDLSGTEMPRTCESAPHGTSGPLPPASDNVGSISTAPRRVRIQVPHIERPTPSSLSHRGYLTAVDEDGTGGDMFEEFRQETAEDIAKLPPNSTLPQTNLQEDAGSDEVRLGTIRYQYYSLRAEPSSSCPTESVTELMNTLPRNLRRTSGHDRTVQGDLLRIAIHRRQQGLHPIMRFEVAALEFEDRYGGDGPWSRSTTDEWECLLQLQLAEHIRNVIRNTHLAPLTLTREHSAQELALMGSDELDQLMTQFLDCAQLLRVLRRNMADLNRQVREARTQAISSSEAPRSSTSTARAILETTSEMLEVLVHATADFVRMASRAEYRHERYLTRLRYEHSLRSGLCDCLEGPVLDPHALPLIYISDLGSSSSGSDEEERTGTTSDEEPVPSSPSPPPSYSESPETGDTEDQSEEDGLWETLSSPNSELFEDPVQGPFTANGTPPLDLGL